MSSGNFMLSSVEHEKKFYSLGLMLVIIAYPQKSTISAYDDVFRGARGINISLSLHLYPYSMFASSECSVGSAHLHRLALAFVYRQCDYYHNLMHRLMNDLSKTV